MCFYNQVYVWPEIACKHSAFGNSLQSGCKQAASANRHLQSGSKGLESKSGGAGREDVSDVDFDSRDGQDAGIVRYYLDHHLNAEWQHFLYCTPRTGAICSCTVLLHC